MPSASDPVAGWIPSASPVAAGGRPRATDPEGEETRGGPPLAAGASAMGDAGLEHE